MILGKVVGTVVASTSNVDIKGARFLLVEKCNQLGAVKGEYVVALDPLGVANDELVMVSESTSARETPQTQNKPIDALIVGIIDLIDEDERIVYKK